MAKFEQKIQILRSVNNLFKKIFVCLLSKQCSWYIGYNWWLIGELGLVDVGYYIKYCIIINRYSVVYLKHMKDIQRKQTEISYMTICTRLWPNVHLHSFNKLAINHWTFRWLSAGPEPAFFFDSSLHEISVISPKNHVEIWWSFAFSSKDNFSI